MITVKYKKPSQTASQNFTSTDISMIYRKTDGLEISCFPKYVKQRSSFNHMTKVSAHTF